MADDLRPASPVAGGLSFPFWAFSAIERLRKAVGISAILVSVVTITTSLLAPLHTDLQRDVQQNRDSLQFEAFKQSPGFLSAWGQRLKENHHTQMKLALVQAISCLLLALITPKPTVFSPARRLTGEAVPLEVVGKACERIQLFVIAVFLTWAAYYLVTAFSYLQPRDLFDRAMLISLNTLPSLWLFWLYIELADLTVEEPGTLGLQATRPRIEESSVRASRIGNASFHRVISVGVLALVLVSSWYGFGKKSKDILIVFDVITGCLNGVALALVVGRLGSKHIDPGAITLGLLYLYSVIQPAAADFHDNAAVQLIATTLALPLKFLFWLVCVWAFTTGILSEYVAELRLLLGPFPSRYKPPD